jgi:hypothetical protein
MKGTGFQMRRYEIGWGLTLDFGSTGHWVLPELGRFALNQLGVTLPSQ